MWLELLREEIRELSYTAFEAGIRFEANWMKENIEIFIFCYNDGYIPFLKQVFKKIQSFVPSKELFETKKTQRLIAYKNRLMEEPYTLSLEYKNDILDNHKVPLDVTIAETEKLTFDEFIELQK